MPAIGPVSPSERALDPARARDIDRVAHDFEAIFLGFLLKEMRQSISEDALFGQGSGSSVYAGLFDTTLAQHLSRNASLGLAETIASQIERML